MSKDLILSYLCNCVLNRRGMVPKGSSMFEESFVEYHTNGIVVIGKVGFRIVPFDNAFTLGQVRPLIFKRTFDTSKFFSFAELIDIFKSIGFNCQTQGWPASMTSHVNRQISTFRMVKIMPSQKIGSSFLFLGGALNVWEEVDQVTASNEVQRHIKSILDEALSTTVPSGAQVTVRDYFKNYLNPGTG